MKCDSQIAAMSLKKKPKAVMFEPERPQDSKKKSLEPIKEGRVSLVIFLQNVNVFFLHISFHFILFLIIFRNDNWAIQKVLENVRLEFSNINVIFSISEKE